MSYEYDRVRAVVWHEDALELLDQRLLPGEVCYRRLTAAADVAQAIRDMVVRGAPAIGIAAAYGVVLAARVRYAENPNRWRTLIGEDVALLAAARPTAVNLFWALRRMEDVIGGLDGDPVARLLIEALAIHQEDIAANRRMARLGVALLDERGAVLTHCNTGSLATAGFGTALGVIRAGVASGRVARVFAGETRPWNQGARLTVWELQQDGIDATLIADSAAAHLMKTGAVQWVVVGADRICANGDTANKIGTYQLAIAARHHGAKFMVVAPSSTVDMATPDGEAIHIEERDPAELLGIGGGRIVAEGVAAWNPVFDVTPASLIDAIVTEKGVIEQPDEARMRATFGG